jgi:hypothetical protein
MEIFSRGNRIVEVMVVLFILVYLGAMSASRLHDVRGR